MRRFTQLFIELDRTKRTSEKLLAMQRYFSEAPPEDAAWALFFLSGRKIKRLVPHAMLDEALRERTALPGWLVRECYEAVGDGAELLALLWPGTTLESTLDMTLHRLVNERMLSLRSIADTAQQRTLITRTWDELDFEQRLVFNKLITGNFRVGVTQTLVVRALAGVAGVPAAVMAHRLAGDWQPAAESFRQLLREAGNAVDRGAQPYPFYLAYPLDQPPQDLGDPRDWQAEWKYDGIRAQVIRRSDQVLIWSRGDELISAAFPEIAGAALSLPADCVIDGEIVAWESGRPLPFQLLQRRINRKIVEPALWADVPVAFVAFDLLEQDGVDMRHRPLRERRSALEAMLGEQPARGPHSRKIADAAPLRVAPVIAFQSWDELAAQRSRSRELSVEGVMLKRLASPYQVGRRAGDWWKWKVDPYTVDAVLIYAQGGSGRRAGVFTDYTFGVWDGDELVPIAKAYSGLTDDEIRQVDRFIRRNTLAKTGPVRVVKPELVFELAFEAIARSQRHKAGLALRFPRMHRWRTDKRAEDADTLGTLRALLRTATAEQP